jgi:hypothetical protein
MAFRTVGTKPQPEILLDHFRTRSSISGIEAAAMYRIRSLHRRIIDLEQRGYEFIKERKKDPTGQRYTRYHFIGKRPETAAA